MYSNGSLHVYFDEISPLHPRFRIPTADVLNEKLLLKISDQSITLNPDKITFEHESNKFIISLSPFQITGYYHGVLCIKTNANNYMNFERYRSQNQDLKPKSQKMDNPIKILDGAGLYEFKDGELRCLDGLWSETYKNKIDVKSRGPSSVACDVEFEGSTHIYGLALHSTDLVLKDTIDEEPYRLFNFDSFMFGIDERSSLYGSSTFIMSKNKQRSSAGVFWMNASDTWVDISTENSSKRSH